MAPTISDTAYAILRVLVARGERAVVGTSEIRAAIGKDPHPVLGRDIIGRGWALKWEGPSELNTIVLAKDRVAGVVLSELGLAAFELGRLERNHELPEPVGAPELKTGKAADPEWWEANKHLFDFDARDGGV